MMNSQELQKIKDEISEIGKLMEQKQNFKIAESKARKLYSQYSNNVSVLNALGIVLAHNSHLDESVTILKKAIKLYPKDYSTYFNLSKTYEKYKKKVDFHLIIPLKTEQRFDCLRKTIELKPDFVQAHHDLGSIYLDANKLDLALSSLTKANEILPNAKTFYKLSLVYSKQNNLIKAFENIKAAVRENLSNDHWSQIFFSILSRMSNLPDSYFDENMEKIIEYNLVSRKDVDASLYVLGSSYILFGLKDFNINFDQVTDKELQLYKILNYPLLNLFLKNCQVVKHELEEILIKFRCSLLKRKINNESPLYNKALNFFSSLAFHSFYNEYLWHFSIEEKKILEDKILALNSNLSKGVKPDDIELYIIAAYYPLKDFPNIKKWLLKNHTNLDVDLKKITQEQIIAFDQELEIEKNIKEVGQISDLISKKVKQQYEGYPYPRWSTLPNILKMSMQYNVRVDILPNEWVNILDSKNLKLADVLIAGCGTGKHTLINAKMDNTLNITSLDLSKKSLSYAIKKSQEYGFKNLEFYQADILNLTKLNKEFDLIECVGVLHHMRDPEKGLKSLLSKLKLKGLIKIGLYSKYARRHVRELRQIIKEKGFENSLTGIREFRSYLDQNCPPKLKKIFQSRDYYSSSTARDLLFHVQEHQLTIPEINSMLKKNNLKFLGCQLPATTKEKYLKEFPNDKYCTNLVNWNLFEEKYPDTFKHMYQFWCQKISENDVS